MILHIVNGNSKDPINDFNVLNRELKLFSPALAAKPQVVVINKIDIPEVEAKKASHLIYHKLFHNFSKIEKLYM
jgi:GTP-binding protein